MQWYVIVTNGTEAVETNTKMLFIDGNIQKEL